MGALQQYLAIARLVPRASMFFFFLLFNFFNCKELAELS